MEVIIEKDSYWIWSILVKIINFFLANLKNSLLLTSSLFFVYIVVVIQIYFQENSNISLIEQLFFFRKNPCTFKLYSHISRTF